MLSLWDRNIARRGQAIIRLQLYKIMKKTDLSFEELRKENPNTGSYSCLAMFVYGKNMKRDLVVRLLNRFVAKGEYEKKDQESLINHLMILTTK